MCFGSDLVGAALGLELGVCEAVSAIETVNLVTASHEEVWK